MQVSIVSNSVSLAASSSNASVESCPLGKLPASASDCAVWRRVDVWSSLGEFSMIGLEPFEYLLAKVDSSIHGSIGLGIRDHVN